MPIIYTYPSATPTASDLLIFSDVSATDPAKDTRKCTVGDIVDLIEDLVPGGGTAKSITLNLGDIGLETSGEKTQTITTTGTFTIGGQLDLNYGGTGLTSFTKGDIIYVPDSEGITAMAKLGIGDENEVLTVGGAGIPSWGPVSSLAVTSVDVSGGSTGLTFSDGPITNTGTITMAGTLIVANGGTGATTLTGILHGNGTGAFTTSNVDLTSEVTGTLPVTNGGIGVATLIDGGILLGSGTGAVTVTNSPTHGQLLIGSTGIDPVLNTLKEGTNITITNTAGDIEIAATGINGIYNGSGSLSGDTVVTTDANDLTFTATTGNVTFNNASSSPTFFIDGASNKVGIGTASPNAVLDVTGDAIFNNLGDDNDFRVESVDNQHMLFVDAGNNRIGINTSTPAKDFHIQKASGETTIRLENASYWSDIYQSGANLFIQNAAGSGSIIFYDDAAERMRIDTNGKVGIGTSLPSANADLTLEGGALAIKETTTPTADTDYGKVYCKADNKLYFQDGAGVEHEIAFV